MPSPEIKHEPPVGLPAQYVRTHVSPRGEVVVEAFGYEDGACHIATAELEQRLGTPGASEEKDDGRQSHQNVY